MPRGWLLTDPDGGGDLPDEPRRPVQRVQEAVLRRVPRPVAGHQRTHHLAETEAAQRRPEGGAADQLQARRRAVGRRDPDGEPLGGVGGGGARGG